jgi:hypothetical protein
MAGGGIRTILRSLADRQGAGQFSQPPVTPVALELYTRGLLKTPVYLQYVQ